MCQLCLRTPVNHVSGPDNRLAGDPLRDARHLALLDAGGMDVQLGGKADGKLPQPSGAGITFANIY